MLSCIRVQKIRDLSELARAQSHGRRLDPSAQSRVDPARTCNNFVSSAYAQCPSDLVSAWTVAVETQGATTYGRAPIALHLIAVVSPAWVSETGDPHSPENPRSLALFAEAQAWARLTFGDNALFAARMDMDEEGAGVVDLFVAPIAQVRINRFCERLIVSTNKALEHLRKRHDARYSYAALQTSWAEHAQAELDPRIRRGTPKAETAREHVHADVYRVAAEQAKTAAKRVFEETYAAEISDFERARLENSREMAEIARKRETIKQLQAEFIRLQAARKARDEELSQRENDLNTAEKALVHTVDLFAAGGLEVRWNEQHGRSAFYIAAHVRGDDRERARASAKTAYKYGLADILGRLGDSAPNGYRSTP